MMKRLLLIIVLSPLLTYSQLKDSLIFLDFGIGFTSDLNYPNKDVNSFSPDMSSSFSHETIVKRGVEFNVGYQIREKWAMGFGLMVAEIYGYNNIEYYNGKFNEKKLFIQYDIFNVKNVDVFSSFSTAIVNYEAQRFLVKDNTQLVINSPDGQTYKMGLDLGLKINFKSDINLLLKHSVNKVFDDGFDGWDYGTDIDLYSFTSATLRVPLSWLFPKNDLNKEN